MLVLLVYLTLGEEVVKLAIKNNIKVIPIPGACAFINALISSGMDTSEFTFLGFLPLNKKNRKEKLEQIKNSIHTIILYEAPHKLFSTLKDLEIILGNRKIVLAKELTKIHEEFISGTASQLLNIIETPKGEFVILIEKNTSSNITSSEFLKNLPLEEHLKLYAKHGLSKKELLKIKVLKKMISINFLLNRYY